MFVGRSTELRAIAAELDVAQEGAARAVHLIGEAGIGKTTLVARAAADAKARGFTVAWGRAWNSTTAPPYSLWSQVLDALGSPRPQLAYEPAADGTGPAPGARTAPLRAFRAAVSAAAADRPLLAVLDDLHDADPGSLTLTTALLRDLPDQRMLVLTTQRPGYARLDELNRQGRRLSVPAFGPDDVADLVRAGGPAGAVDVDALLHATGGNPFLITEALNTGTETALLHRTGVRLDALDQDARRLVAAAAVTGHLPVPGILAAVAGLPPRRFAAAAAQATAAGILVERHGFRHEIIRGHCYDRIPVTERAMLHTAAADALQQAGVQTGYAPAMAHHRRAALPFGDPAAAVAATCVAARAALRAAAATDAAAQCTAGLTALDAYGDTATAWRAQLLTLRGEAEVADGDPVTGRRTLIEAMGMARAAGEPLLVGEAALRLPRVERFLSADPELERQLTAAVELIGDTAPTLRIRLLARLAHDVAMGNGQPDAGGRPSMDRVVTEARAHGDPALLAETLSARLSVLWSPETLADRLATGPEITRLGQRCGDRARELDGLLWTFVAQLESGSVDGAYAALSRYTAHADRGGQPAQLLYARSRSATLHALRGRYAETEALAAEAHAHALAAGSPDADPLYIAQLAMVAWARGGATAERLADACRGSGALEHPLLAVVVPLFAGRLEDSRWPVRAMRGMLDRIPGPSRLYASQLLAEAAHALDEPDLAADLYPLLLPYPDRCAVSSGGAATTGAVARALGLCALTVGDLDTAVSWLRAAVDRNRAIGAEPYVAAARADLAEALLRQGQPADDLLTEAADAARALGMDRLTARVALLRAPTPDGSPEHDVRAVAQAVAVLGAGADTHLLAAACDLPAERFLTALGRQGAARPAVTPAARQRIHLRAAEAMERLGMHRHRPDRLALHRRSALPLGDPGTAVSATLTAARAALREFRPADAAASCDAGLAAIAPYGRQAAAWRAELLTVLGTARVDTGDLPAARSALTEAVDVADAAGIPQIAAEATLRMPLPERYLPGSGAVEAALRARLDGAAPVQRVRLLARLAADALAARRGVDEERETLIGEAVAEARRLGDGPLLAEVLLARLRVALGPDTLDERLAVSVEAINLCRRHDLVAEELEGRLSLFSALLEAGRVEHAEVELHCYESQAERTGHGRFLMFARSRRGTLAALRGDLDAAERLAEEAWELGRALTPDAALLLEVQRFAVSWSRGRFPPGTHTDAALKATPYYPLLLVVALIQQGRTDQARAHLRESLSALDAIPSPSRLYLLTVLGELAHRVDEPVAAAEIRRRLAPYADRCVVHALGSACAGSAARALGLCALTTGDLDGAIALLRRAVEANHRYGAVAFVAATRRELADALRRRGAAGDAAEVATLLSAPESVAVPSDPDPARPTRPAASGGISLTRQAGTWLLTVHDRSVHLRHSKGLAQLATLLANPGREIPAVELAGGVACGQRTPVLDEATKRAYRRRLAELDLTLEHAARCGDAAADARASRERDAVVAQLKRDAGLGGRTRAFTDDAERARVNVTRTLRQAVEEILAADAEAGLLLRAAVRTGNRCVYDPVTTRIPTA